MSSFEELYLEKKSELNEKYKRDLPLQDTLFNRWERAKELGFGDGTSIYNSAFIFEKVSVGQNTWIGPYTVLDGTGGGIQIGDNCSISAGVHLYTHDTVMWALSGGKEAQKKGPISIGNNCYIGSQSIINVGVTIGDQSIVAANSFVNKDIPPRSIYAGNPAKKIGDVLVENDEIKLVYHDK